jgi:3'-phosphoadenosine 5'-phosphosulfate sulfotransferase (PAPS reductase)/FAD synthetase
MNKLFDTLTTLVKGKNAQQIIAAVCQSVPAERVVIASSLAAEDQVLTCEAANLLAHPRFFTLDTGRLFQEVYETMEATAKKYGIKYGYMHRMQQNSNTWLQPKARTAFFAASNCEKNVVR